MSCTLLTRLIAVETSWKEERLMFLNDIFNRFDNKALLIEISDILRKGLEDPHELSAELEKFQSNICVFVEGMTGEKALNYPKAIQSLRNMSVNKNEQAKVLYEAIERQQMEIIKQQQIIACLEFRHALEELPNMTSTMQLPPRPAHGHAGAWKRTWRLAVECELDEMIRIYIDLSTENSATGIQANISQSAGPSVMSGALPAPESASPGKHHLKENNLQQSAHRQKLKNHRRVSQHLEQKKLLQSSQHRQGKKLLQNPQYLQMRHQEMLDCLSENYCNSILTIGRNIQRR